MTLAYLQEMLERSSIKHERKADGTLTWAYASKYPGYCYPINASAREEGCMYAEVFFPCSLSSLVAELCGDISGRLPEGLRIGYDAPARSGFYLQARFKPDDTEDAVTGLACACEKLLPLYVRLLEGGDWAPSLVFLTFADDDVFGHA